MGKNKSPPVTDSEGRLFVDNHHPYVIKLMGFVYVAAIFAGGAVTFMDTGCDIGNTEPLSGHGKWLYTLILGFSSGCFAIYGIFTYYNKHVNAWYIHMARYPPIYATFVLLWIVELGLYAVPFPNCDPSVPGMVCMKNIIYTSAGGIPVWIVITVVSFLDQRKFKYVQEWIKQRLKEGDSESSVTNYPMNDYMGGHDDAHHRGYHYYV